MPTELLSVGYTHTLTQNAVYALPSVAVWIQSSGLIQTSLDGTNWTADITASTTSGVVTSAPFVRSTLASTIVSVKKYS